MNGWVIFNLCAVFIDIVFCVLYGFDKSTLFWATINALCAVACYDRKK